MSDTVSAAAGSPIPEPRRIEEPPKPVDPATIPALLLTQADLQQLDAMLGELPMKYGLAFLNFINQRRLRQAPPQPQGTR